LKTLRKRTGKKKDQFTKPDEFQSLTQRVYYYIQQNAKTVYAALARY